MGIQQRVSIAPIQLKLLKSNEYSEKVTNRSESLNLARLWLTKFIHPKWVCSQFDHYTKINVISSLMTRTTNWKTTSTSSPQKQHQYITGSVPVYCGIVCTKSLCKIIRITLSLWLKGFQLRLLLNTIKLHTCYINISQTHHSKYTSL